MRIMVTVFAFYLAISQVQAAELQEAWMNMMQNHPSIKAAQAKLNSREAGLSAANASRLPRLDASANYQYTSEIARTRMQIPALAPGMQPIDREISVGDHDGAELGVTASYIAFSGFAQTNQIAAQKLSVEASKREEDVTKRQLGFQFGLIYYGFRLASVEMELRQKKIGAWLSHVNILETQHNAGVATIAQKLSAKAQLAKVVADTAAGRRTLDSLTAEFKALTGVNATLDNQRHFEVRSLDSTSRSPAAEGLEIQAQSLEKSCEVATSGKYPFVSTYAGYRYGNPGMNQGTDEWMGYAVIGIQAQWNLFDGMERKFAKSRLNSEAEVLRAEALRVRKNQQTALATLTVEERAMQSEKIALTTGLEAASAALEAYKSAFANGVSTADDLLDAELLVAELSARLEQWKIRKQIIELKNIWISGVPMQLMEVSQ